MIDRFTDRFRKTMALAIHEAERLNSISVEPEHILLGIVREGSGVGATLLKQCGIDAGRVRRELDAVLGTGPEPPAPFKRAQSPRSESVIEFAADESRRLNHNYVGTEHLLLGLLREHEGAAARVLAQLGLELGRGREEVRRLLGASKPERPRATVREAADPTCPICGTLEQIRRGGHPGLIAELSETYAVLGDNQGLRGWCVLLLKGHREHLSELGLERQCLIFADVARMAAAVKAVVQPRRINYECLGNVVPHIHWHVIPRHEDDPEPRAPVWGWSAERLRGNMSEAERAELVHAIREAL